jgi:hypothetical protein
MSGRPRAGYYTADGERVPGVTTICDLIKDSGGLVHWAWKLGIDGVDYRAVRDAAATAGTIAHDMVETHILGGDYQCPPETPVEVEAKARQAFENFLRWEAHNKLEIIATEQSMVSERHRFGGTLDGIGVAQVNGDLALVDWKSSARLYETYLAQLAAYARLWNELNPDSLITGGFHLCRFSKEHGDFQHSYFSELDDGWAAFLHARALYDLRKKLKARIG